MIHVSMTLFSVTGTLRNRHGLDHYRRFTIDILVTIESVVLRARYSGFMLNQKHRWFGRYHHFRRSRTLVITWHVSVTITAIWSTGTVHLNTRVEVPCIM